MSENLNNDVQNDSSDTEGAESSENQTEIQNISQTDGAETNILIVWDEEHDLLLKWVCEELMADFSEKNIKIDSFKEMTMADIDYLIPKEKYGLRIKFRTHLLNWRKSNGFVLSPIAETLSINSRLSSSNFEINSSIVSSNSASPLSPILTEARTSAVRQLFPNQHHTLEQILCALFIGKSILDLSKTNCGLNSSNRNDLCEIIANYWIKNEFNQILSSPYHKKIVGEIINLFPDEVEEYFVSKDKRIKRKLAQKYSLCRKYRERDVIESRYNLKRRKSADDSTFEDQLVYDHDIDETAIGNQQWLKANKQPEALLVEKWRATFNLRKKTQQQKFRFVP